MKIGRVGRTREKYRIQVNVFLKLAVQAVRDVNIMRDENRMRYPRKTMIRCGLSLILDAF